MAKNKRYSPKKDITKKKKNKKKYKLRNWKEYNETLVNRGRLDVWVEKGILEKWYSKPTGRPGAQRKYTDKAVELTLRFGQVFHQKLRQTEGLVNSFFKALEMELEVPDHSFLSRRGETIVIELPKEHRKVVTIVVDSSGLKVYGEGEWKVRKHGYSKHRTWSKIHLAVAPDGEIRAQKLTGNNISDEQAFPELIEQETADIDKIAGDGAFDKSTVYNYCQEKGIQTIAIPPQKNGRIWQHGNSKLKFHPRDENLRAIRKSSRKKWKENIGYHVRSIGENVYFRWKTVFGDKLNARKAETQEAEAAIKASILNKMRILGMPDSYAVS